MVVEVFESLAIGEHGFGERNQQRSDAADDHRPEQQLAGDPAAEAEEAQRSLVRAGARALFSIRLSRP
jgi:hypothetical protein